MAVRESYVTWKGRKHSVRWDEISRAVYVHNGCTWQRAGDARDMDGALDQALGWLHGNK